MSLLLNRGGGQHRKPILSPPSSSSAASSPISTPTMPNHHMGMGQGNPGQRWFTMLALPDQPTLARRDLNGFRTRPPPPPQGIA